LEVYKYATHPTVRAISIQNPQAHIFLLSVCRASIDLICKGFVIEKMQLPSALLLGCSLRLRPWGVFGQLPRFCPMQQKHGTDVPGRHRPVHGYHRVQRIYKPHERTLHCNLPVQRWLSGSDWCSAQEPV